jgi:hypothetical protein
MIHEKPQSNAAIQSSRAIVFLLVFSSFLLIACDPVLILPLRVKPANGTGKDLKAEPDTSVIQPGVSTRAEVLQQFAAFDTGWKGERLFLGRWAYSGMEAMGGRWWGGKILAVEFDEKGVVTRYRVLSDDDFLRDRDSYPLTPAKENQDEPQIHSIEIFGYRIEAREIKQLSRWRYATVYSPAITTARDIGVVIHLKQKIYRSGDVEKKHGVTSVSGECNVSTAVLLMLLLRSSNGSAGKM